MFTFIIVLLTILIVCVITVIFTTSFMISEEQYESYMIAINAALYIMILGIVVYFISLVFTTVGLLKTLKDETYNVLYKISERLKDPELIRLLDPQVSNILQVLLSDYTRKR
jgi:uncharacterized membrane protein